MIDIVAYRAVIGIFCFIHVASRSSRSYNRQEKHSIRRRKYFTVSGYSYLFITFFVSLTFISLICKSNFNDTTFVTSEVCGDFDQLCFKISGSVNFDQERQYWPILKFLHYMKTNRGAHAYNGNPRTPGIKKRIDPMQQTLKSLMKKSCRIDDNAGFSDDSLDCFTLRPSSPTPCTSIQSTPVVSTPVVSTPISEPHSEPDETSCQSTDLPPSIVISDDNLNDTPSTPNKYDRFKQGFLKSWFEKKPSLKEWCKASNKGSNFAYCFICNKDLKVEGGGLKDLLKHPKSVKHLTTLNEQKTTKPLIDHFEPSVMSEQVANAEILWCTFITEHQLSFRICDHASKLFSKMFPDSNIAKEFKCGRTKARNIICNAVAPKMEENVAKTLQNSFFSVLTDETTDVTIKSQCCVLVRYFDSIAGTVKGVFFKLVNLKSATGEAVFRAITEAFEKSNVPIKNIIALGTDGAATMIGKTKGLFGRFKKIQQNIFSVWCICHQVHIAVKKASNVFPKEVHDLPIELFYWFKKSYKRCSSFTEMQNFCNVIDHKLLKPSDTRWLATQEIAQRLSEQWQPLKAYFNSLPTDFEIDPCGKKRKVDKLTRDKILKIRKMMNSDLNQLCFLFMRDSLKKFTKFNLYFQTTKPVAYTMNTKLYSLLKDLLSSFIQPSVINANSQNLIGIDENCEENLCDKEDMWIGDISTFTLLTELEDNGKQVVVDQFYDLVKQFYTHSVREIKKLPFDDDVIKNLKALDPLLQSSTSVRKMFMHLAKEFPNIIDPKELGSLDSGLRLYDTFDLPCMFSEDFEIIEGKRATFVKGVDNFWWKIGKIYENGTPVFPVLSKFAKALLCIPHGNAESEQLFSRLKLTKTKFKSHMSTATLNSCLTVNFNLNCDCFSFQPSKDVINKVRLGLQNDKPEISNVVSSSASSHSSVCATTNTSPSKPRVKRARKNNSLFNDFVPV